MRDDLQPWIDLSTHDEKEWIQARYDGGGLPPGIASRMLKVAVKKVNRGSSRTIPARPRRAALEDSRPTGLSDWERLVRRMREFTFDPSE
jgi:hypothetical protein